MKETIARLKTIISKIENGEIKGESLNKINRLIDAMMIETDDPNLKTETEKTKSYREELENLDKSLILKKIEVNKMLLTKKKKEILNQFDKKKFDTEKCIQLLSLNECVLENLQDFKSDKIEEKLLFSHWKIDPNDFLIDFKANNSTWDYASTFDYDNINDILSLGLDVPDDFEGGGLWSLKEPYSSIVENLFKQPFKKPIFLFFVNRNSVYYLNDSLSVYPKLDETKNINFIKSMIPKLRISKMLIRLQPDQLDKQLVRVSKMFNKALKTKVK